MALNLTKLDPKKSKFTAVEQTFFESWYHLESKDTPYIRTILRANRKGSYRRRRFEKHQKNANERKKKAERGKEKSPIAVTRRLWRGAEWGYDCPLLKDERELHPDRSRDHNCDLCKIFSTELEEGPSGEGLQFMHTSSKAHNSTGKESIKALVLFDVVVGKACAARGPQKSKPKYYDSVVVTHAETTRPADSKYNKYTIYDCRAAFPAYIVIYHVLPRRYPKIVALGLEGTIWENHGRDAEWGRGLRYDSGVEECLELRGNRVQDKNAPRNYILLLDGIPSILKKIKSQTGARLAVVSTDQNKAIAIKAMELFTAKNRTHDNKKTISVPVPYKKIGSKSKVEYLKVILKEHQNKVSPLTDFSDMILFDSEADNDEVGGKMGVTFQLVREGEGLIWDTYQQGLKAWRRAKNITTPSKTPLERKLIGFSALRKSRVKHANTANNEEWIVDDIPLDRWGYGLYVTHKSESMSEELELYGVFTRDYAAWKKVNKVWIPEDDVSEVLAMNNQEDRDQHIARKWKVETPYVLFSEHESPSRTMSSWSQDLYHEMVIYTQVLRALIYVTPTKDIQGPQHRPRPFDHHRSDWGIKSDEDMQE